MPDPFVFPAGFATAAFIMAALSWYGMLRTGVQLVHDDWKANMDYKEDVDNMIADVVLQERGFEHWKRKWMISEHTPDKILSIYWGEEERRLIETKLRLIKTKTDGSKKELKKITGLKVDDWMHFSDFKKKRKAKYIYAKKKYIQNLIDIVPTSIAAIKEASERGWEIQQQGLYAGINNNTPYHTQIALLLVQISKYTRQDLNALRVCTQTLQDFSIELDLDLFNAIAEASKHAQSATVAAAASAGCMKLDLLLRESNVPTAEMVRARVERSMKQPECYARAVDAFKTVMTDPQQQVCYFALNTSTVFSLLRCCRKGDPCSPTRESLRQKILGNGVPSYDQLRNKLNPSTLILGDLSTFRVAYELSQACIILLRTTWMPELCSCGLRCGDRQDSTSSWYEFGLNIATAHHNNPVNIGGTTNQPSCMVNSGLYDLTRSLRRLGFLLLEITLGTLVASSSTDAAGSISQISLHVGGTAPNRQLISLNNAMGLVGNAVHGSDGFVDAVKCCLTRVLDPAPADLDWEEMLLHLYFDIVKPLKDLYDLKLTTFPVRRHPAYTER